VDATIKSLSDLLFRVGSR